MPVRPYVPADLHAHELWEERRAAPEGPTDRLVGALLNAVRRTAITAAPPAHLAPTVWSSPVDQSGRLSLPAAVTPYQTVVSYRCPQGRWTKISAYGVNVQDATYTYDGSILWRFLLNGRPIGDGMSDWAQQRGSIIQPRDTSIILQDRGLAGGLPGQGDFLEFQVSRAVVAAGAQIVEMAFQGWNWKLRNTDEGTQGSVSAY